VIRLIREHNIVNGLRFTVIEFTVMVAVVTGFAIYFAAAGASVPAVVCLGVAANCIAVAEVSLGSLRAGEEDRSLAATFSASARARILEEHPGAQRATWLLSALTLLPFAVAIGVVIGRVRRHV